jgi:hypothetical protein
MNFPVYLFNNTAATLIFNDIGLELPLTEFFEVIDSEHWEDEIYKAEMKLAIQLNKVLLYRTAANMPPLAEDQVSLEDPNQRIFDGGFASSSYLIEYQMNFGNASSEYERNDLIDCGRSA